MCEHRSFESRSSRHVWEELMSFWASSLHGSIDCISNLKCTEHTEDVYRSALFILKNSPKVSVSTSTCLGYEIIHISVIYHTQTLKLDVFDAQIPLDVNAAQPPGCMLGAYCFHMNSANELLGQSLWFGRSTLLHLTFLTLTYPCVW